MTYLRTARCRHGHASTVRYASELGRCWIEDLARKAFGPDSHAMTARFPHKPGEERCATCGSDQFVWSVDTSFDDVAVTGARA